MVFWWIMLAFSLLIPLVMILGGRLMWKRCPKEINFIYGYRTARSMVNEDTWKFAHEHCGRLWWRWGFLTLIPSVLIQLPFYGGSEETVGIVGTVVMVAQCLVLLISLAPTEAALKKTFTEDGKRR